MLPSSCCLPQAKTGTVGQHSSWLAALRLLAASQSLSQTLPVALANSYTEEQKTYAVDTLPLH